MLIDKSGHQQRTSIVVCIDKLTLITTHIHVWPVSYRPFNFRPTDNSISNVIFEFQCSEDRPTNNSILSFKDSEHSLSIPLPPPPIPSSDLRGGLLGCLVLFECAKWVSGGVQWHRGIIPSEIVLGQRSEISEWINNCHRSDQEKCCR